MTRKTPANRAGFSVIEALVALAIAAIGLIAIFSLQQQLVSGQRHYEQALRRAEDERNILALLRDLNPVERPEGALSLPPNQRLSWTSQPLNDFRQTTGFPIGNGTFQVRLYRVRAEIDDSAGRPLKRISFDRLGWRKMGVPEAAAVAGATPPPRAP